MSSLYSTLCYMIIKKSRKNREGNDRPTREACERGTSLRGIHAAFIRFTAGSQKSASERPCPSRFSSECKTESRPSVEAGRHLQDSRKRAYSLLANDDAPEIASSCQDRCWQYQLRSLKPCALEAENPPPRLKIQETADGARRRACRCRGSAFYPARSDPIRNAPQRLRHRES